MSDRGRRRVVLTPRRGDLVDAAFVVVLCALALVGFRTTYSGMNYLLVGIAGVVLGVLIGHLANALRQPMITVAVMAVAVFFLLGGAVALRAQAVAGVLPTPGTVRALASASVHGWKQLLTTLPPVDGTGPLLAIPYILGLLGGAGAFTMARRLRYPAAPLIAPGGVLAAVILLGTAKPAAQLLQGVVFAVVALGWASVRGMRQRPPVQNGSGRRSRFVTAVALVGLAAAGAAVAGPHLPGTGHTRVVLRSYVTPPFDIGAYPSPLVGFRKYTKDANVFYDTALFTVSGLPDGDFIRIATLDDYDGSVWGATSGTVPTGPGQPLDSFQRVGSHIETDAHGTEATLNVTIDSDGDYASSNDVNAWLPTAGAVNAIQFAGPNKNAHAEQFRYNLATTEGIVPDRLRTGDSYTLHTIISEPSVSADAQPFGSPTVSPTAYEFTSTQATQWAKGGGGTVAEILAVARHLLDSGAYSDGGNGRGQYLPGHSFSRLKDFLKGQQPVGDDEQYAAAFALMSNSLGLPARVVLGAVPEADGTVKGEDVHTWVEVHLSDGSWASISYKQFMPPPSKQPDKQPPQQQQQAAASIVPPPNTVRPPSTLDQASQADSTSSHANNHPSRASGFHIPGFVLATLQWGGPPALVIAVVCSTIIGLKARRRRRRRTRGPAATRVSRGWREVVDHARDLGAVVPSGRTRREEARTLAAHDLAALAAAADSSVFGPGDPPDETAADYWMRVDEARKTMSGSVGRWRRLRAVLSLRSFSPRSGADPAGAQ